jgi:transcriptional regulator with XRE-family HTH domain
MSQAAFHQRLKFARKYLGLTVAQAATAASVGRATWERYEKGDTAPTPSQMMPLINEGIDPTWLLTGQGAMVRGEDKVEDAQPSQLDKKLIGRLTDKIIRTYRELGMGIAWHEAAEMAVDEHNRIVTSVADPVDRMVCVGEFAAELRQRLLAKPDKTDTGKRQA